MCYTSVPTLRSPLSLQIEQIKKTVNTFKYPNLKGILLIGSCARGEATYRSDIDLLVILELTKLTRDTSNDVARSLESALADCHSTPLPIQVNVVISTVFETEDRNMRNALRDGILLLDTDGSLGEKYDK